MLCSLQGFSVKTKKVQSIVLGLIENFDKKKSFVSHKNVLQFILFSVQAKEASDGSRIFERIKEPNIQRGFNS